MKTIHRLFFQDSRKMKGIKTESINLVITSSPYPIIDLWDELFSKLNPKIEEVLFNHDGLIAFELMHQELDQVWKEISRVVIPGGIVCINIGDAVRTLGKSFQLYPNHSRINSAFLKLGFLQLPGILWRKPTNAPNKFMGSGMLPPGAYVTLEHEHILIYRKGTKRLFRDTFEKNLRRESAFFWEERNEWFSDIWILKGESQILADKKLRSRSAAYPFDLAYRLINMFSIKNDTVLDPFLGTGTSTIAAMIAGRNSIGFEIDETLREMIISRINKAIEMGRKTIDKRIQTHQEYINSKQKEGEEFKYKNNRYGFQIKTQQEKELYFDKINDIIEIEPNVFEVLYE